MTIATERPPTQKLATFGISERMYPFDYLQKEQLFELVDKEYRFQHYSKEGLAKEKKSIEITTKIAHLLSVDEVWASEEGSKLDCHLKIDIILQQESRYIGFQVKGSERSYSKYLRQWQGRRLSPHGWGTNTATYPAPGCIWVDQNTNKLELLLALSRWLKVSISEKTKNSLAKFRQLRHLKVTSINSDIAQLMSCGVDDYNVWATLELATICNGQIRYLK